MEQTTGKLIGSPKRSRLSGPSVRRLTVSVKMLDAEQTASARMKALQLFCRGMIRLYLKDHASNSENGKSLGIL